jgi:hypothetical protein
LLVDDAGTGLTFVTSEFRNEEAATPNSNLVNDIGDHNGVEEAPDQESRALTHLAPKLVK